MLSEQPLSTAGSLVLNDLQHNVRQRDTALNYNFEKAE
jgi:hypothetical protein